MPFVEHNFQTHGPKAFYNLKGEYQWCHSKEDVARSKQEGFTSANYVRSEWPKCAYHQKTGLTRTVGRLEWTDEQNMAAVKALGPDWGLEHAHVPEPVVEQKVAAPDVTGLMAQMLTAMNASNERMANLEAAALEAEDQRKYLEGQLSDMQDKMAKASQKQAAEAAEAKAAAAAKTKADAAAKPATEKPVTSTDATK